MKNFTPQIFLLFYIFFFCTQATTANALRVEEGEILITENTNWGPGLIEISNTYKIADGATLTIMAGTSIEFTGFYKIQVHGSILAEGTANSPILFTVKDSTNFSDYESHYGAWEGIWLDNSNDMDGAAGAMSDNSTTVFNHCTFKHAKAIDFHGSDYAEYGGAFIIRDFSNVTFSNCTFSKCAAESGGAIAIVGNAKPTFDHCNFSYNYANSGGAIFCGGTSAAVFTNCILSNNYAQKYGGAWSCIDGASFDCTNTLINNNTSVKKGGAFFNDGTSRIRILNSAIINNFTQQSGAAAYVESTGTMSFINTIIWGNRNVDYNNKQIFGFSATPVQFENCDIENGEQSWFGNTAKHNYIKCINNLPQWSSSPSGFGYMHNWDTNGLTLNDNSPCVNAGTIDVSELNLPQNDLTNNSRIGGGKIDIGPIENQTVLAPPEYFLKPNTAKVFCNLSEANHLLIDIVKINADDFSIKELSGLEPPLSATQDGKQIKITAYSLKPAFVKDTLTVKTNYGDQQIILDYVFGLVGNVNGSWSNDTIIVAGDLTVADGKTLLIEPGVEVFFAGEFGIDVHGKLLALGFANDFITFNTIAGAHKWKGISFNNNASVDSSKILYSNFENAEKTSGGAIRIDQFSRLLIKGSNFRSCNAVEGGCIAITNNSKPDIIYNYFGNSNAERGGAIYCSESSPVLKFNRFYGNRADDGAALYCDANAHLTVHNSQFLHNKSNDKGGAVFIGKGVQARFYGNSFGYNTSNVGGAIYCSQSSPRFVNNTISNNLALAKGGGIFCSPLSTPEFINTIIYFNKKLNTSNQLAMDGEATFSAQALFDHCNIEGGREQFEHRDTLAYNIANYTNNIDRNPSFVGVNKYPFRLKTASPIIDKGAVGTYSELLEVDMVHTSRVYNGRIDIGAHEYHPTNSPFVKESISTKRLVEPASFNFEIPFSVFDDIDEGDSLRYTAQIIGMDALPNWLNYDERTMGFSGSVGNADIGVYTVNLRAIDDYGAYTQTPFVIVVKDTNEPPYVSSGIANLTAKEGELLDFIFPQNAFADDDLNDVLSYTATYSNGSVLPNWLSFSSEERRFTGTPNTNDIESLEILVTATDISSNSASTSFALELSYIDHAPDLNIKMIDQIVYEDEAFKIIIPENAFTDINPEDVLSYSLLLNNSEVLPLWLHFDAENRIMTGTPLSSDLGIYNCSLIAIDSKGLSNSDDFMLEVKNTNDPPYVKVTPPSPVEIFLGQEFTISLEKNTFEDDDPEDELTYSAQEDSETNLPEWLNFDNNDLKLSGIPIKKGVTWIKLLATDRAGASTSVLLTLYASKGVGVENNSLNRNLSVFPNPAKDVLDIIISDCTPENGSLHFFAIDGKLIKEHEIKQDDFNNNQLKISTNVSNWNHGVYFVKIILNEATYFKKILVLDY